MQLPPTLLCCMSPHLSETLFGHSEPGKSHCLLIGKNKTKQKKQNKHKEVSKETTLKVFLTALVHLSSFW